MKHGQWAILTPVIARACQLKRDLGMVQLNEYEVPLVVDRPPSRETKNGENMMEKPLKSITDQAVGQTLFKENLRNLGLIERCTQIDQG